MIAPKMIGDAALIARFAAIPTAWRAALAGEADRLGRELRDQVARSAAGEPVSVAVDSTADGVTLTGATRPGPAARPQHATTPTPGPTSAATRHPRSHRFQRPAGVHAEPPGIAAAFVAMRPEFRVRLETVFRRVAIR